MEIRIFFPSQHTNLFKISYFQLHVQNYYCPANKIFRNFLTKMFNHSFQMLYMELLQYCCINQLFITDKIY